ncbi:hypothetical protein [Xenorhabdus santafensis]|nr:hypothetical protein [Xenorhabdus sp. 12]
MKFTFGDCYGRRKCCRDGKGYLGKDIRPCYPFEVMVLLFRPLPILLL